MTREISLDILMEVLEKDGFSNAVIQNTLMKYQYMDKQSRAFLTRLCEGVIERMLELDYVIDCYSKTKTQKMKPLIRSLLRMGAYQILYMDQIPDSAACNEAVKLAEKRGFYNLKGFVNGVLRTISRNKGSIPYPDKKKDCLEYLKITYSMPEWILNLWHEEYDWDTVEKLLKSFIGNKKNTIRVNTEKISVEKLSERLSQEGAVTEEGAYLPYALKISGYDHLTALPSFLDGLFCVQDESSMLVCECAGIKEGDFIMDVCSAPGGKACHAGELLRGTGQVLARDLTQAKIEKIQENVKRLGLSNVTIQCRDALIFTEEEREKADVVIADLPCSGLGVIGRKGDIKYKTKEEDVNNLADLQRRILAVVKDYVKPGGILMYSTCTINRHENMDNAAWFQENFEFSLEASGTILPDGCRQLLPGIHSADGFFLARFRKNRS